MYIVCVECACFTLHSMLCGGSSSICICAPTRGPFSTCTCGRSGTKHIYCEWKRERKRERESNVKGQWFIVRLLSSIIGNTTQI